MEEAFVITRELCSKYAIDLRGVAARRKKGALGTAYTRHGKIIYSTLLFGESRWSTLKTVCHEVAHLLAAKRYSKNCLHDRRFQLCEEEIDAIHGFKPVYARRRGYAVAYFDMKSGLPLDCRRGYKIKNGAAVIDRERKANDRILRKVMKEAFFAKAFIRGGAYESVTCEPVGGRLALTMAGCDDKMNDTKAVIYQSELASDNFNMKLKNVKYSGRSLRYNIEGI